MSTTEPPDEGNPWPEGAEPYEGQSIEVIPVEYAPDDGTRRIGPAVVVVAVAAGYAGNMLFTGDKGWVLDTVFDPITRQPVLDFERPPVVYSQDHSMVFRLEGDRYVAAGPARME